jgi:hypothetical protein
MGWFVCPLLVVEGSNLESILLISAVADLETLHVLFKVQECRFITPSQDAGITVLSMGGWVTHSPALRLQTQHHKW